MVHSFTYKATASGCSLLFMVNNKQRRIIFVKNTDAMIAFEAAQSGQPMTTDREWMEVIDTMRKNGWVFKANTMNESIFRPIARKQTQSA